MAGNKNPITSQLQIPWWPPCFQGCRTPAPVLRLGDTQPALQGPPLSAPPPYIRPTLPGQCPVQATGCPLLTSGSPPALWGRSCWAGAELPSSPQRMAFPLLRYPCPALFLQSGCVACWLQAALGPSGWAGSHRRGHTQVPSLWCAHRCHRQPQIIPRQVWPCWQAGTRTRRRSQAR